MNSIWSVAVLMSAWALQMKVQQNSWESELCSNWKQSCSRWILSLSHCPSLCELADSWQKKPEIFNWKCFCSYDWGYRSSSYTGVKTKQECERGRWYKNSNLNYCHKGALHMAPHSAWVNHHKILWKWNKKVQNTTRMIFKCNKILFESCLHFRK